jgi:hypothetical protein
MKHAPGSAWRRIGLCAGILILLGLAAMRLCAHGQPVPPEIALVIGEPYEDMRKRSTAEIGPAVPGVYFFNIPKSDARLRLVDPIYGFVTPEARFFTVGFDEEGRVSTIRMSPQIEPLLLDDTLKILLYLQEQWRHGGWKPIWPEREPPFADTPEWRAELRSMRGGTTYWQAGTMYQVLLTAHRFPDDKRPNEERYLITLDIAEPWLE